LTWTCEPAHPAWNELLAAVTAAGQAAGLDPFVGRRLPALLRGAGLVDVGVCAHQYVWRPGDLYHGLLVGFVAIHSERIIDGGYLTPERIDELTAELEQHLAQPETLAIYTPLFQGWGRTPCDIPVVEPRALAAGTGSAIGARHGVSRTGRGCRPKDQRLRVIEEIFDSVLVGAARQCPIVVNI
jgi:hypothetical protein